MQRGWQAVSSAQEESIDKPPPACITSPPPFRAPCSLLSTGMKWPCFSAFSSPLSAQPKPRSHQGPSESSPHPCPFLLLSSSSALCKCWLAVLWDTPGTAPCEVFRIHCGLHLNALPPEVYLQGSLPYLSGPLPICLFTETPSVTTLFNTATPSKTPAFFPIFFFTCGIYHHLI